MSSLLRMLGLVVFVGLAGCAGKSGTSYDPGIFSGASGSADDVLFRTLGLVGTPYRYGGNTPASGFDCSGLVGFVYQDAAGIRLPRTTRELAALNLPPVSRKALQGGDLLFFATAGGRRVSHVAIYVGDGRFVHAPSTGGTVRLDHLDNSYWQRAYLSAKRVISADLARQ